MEGNDSLTDVAVRHGSDKLDHGYIPLYAAHLEPWRAKPLRLLEIGVGGYTRTTTGGASLRMWADYFADAQIVGLDVQEKDLDLPACVTIVQGSQADPEVLDRLHAEHGPFDVVIDDGSHVNDHRNTTFAHLFPRLPIGGVYVLEDLHTSYLRHFGGKARDLNSPATTTGLLKQLIDGLHHAYVPGRQPEVCDRIVSGLCVYPKDPAFVIRGDNDPKVAWNDQRSIDHELAALRDDDR